MKTNAFGDAFVLKYYVRYARINDYGKLNRRERNLIRGYAQNLPINVIKELQNGEFYDNFASNGGKYVSDVFENFHRLGVYELARVTLL